MKNDIVELTDREHILKRPAMYIEAVDEKEVENKSITDSFDNIVTVKVPNVLSKDSQFNFNPQISNFSAINLLKFGEAVVYNKSYQTLGKGLSEYKTFRHLDFCATHKSQMSELELQLL